MNYRHAFHAGNHADVLKHVALLALCDALVAKPSACFALDTHAGRGLYRLESSSARCTGEADDGIGRLLGEGRKSVVWGERVAVLVDMGGRSLMTQKSTT